jgi:23S rRNA pseudouridine1911/1915/1917 synthase
VSEDGEVDEAAGEGGDAGAVERIELEVLPEEAGERLDRWLGRKLRPTYSRSFLVTRIEEGAVVVNGAPVRQAYQIAAGDKVVVDARVPDRAPKGEPIALEVPYEDDHLAVVVKPVGMLVHPSGAGGSGTLVNAMLHRWPKVATVGPMDRPGIVHRLDRDTSGVMVVALTNPARVKLVNQFKARTVKKEYRAIVVGKVALQSDYIDLAMGQDKSHPERQRIDLRDGKPASTYYEVVERLPGYTYVRCHPLTGRTHQIRLHLAHLGHPCVADPIYGRNHGVAWRRLVEDREKAGMPLPQIRRQALHALRLRFIHPVDGREIDVESKLAPDMEELLVFLRGLK